MILEKPRVLKRYIAGSIALDEAYQRAKISQVEENVRQAKTLLDDVTKGEVSKLERPRFTAFKQDARKLSRAVQRIEKMIKEIDVQ